MALEEYRQKRRFEHTPEPAAIEGRRGSGGRFCLQRHQASRLHYDLRLEWDHRLLSWAVPKGPTLCALDKRLAVQTEDHPLEYLEWEGVIPDGNYGAGTMMVFDLGFWEPAGNVQVEEALAKGDFKFRLWGQKVAGEWALVKTKKDSWLLIKKEDRWCRFDWDPEALNWSAVSGRSFLEVAAGQPAPAPFSRSWPAQAVASPLPLEVAPMLAQISEPFDSQEWSFELKWDGVRALCYCQDQSLSITSRAGNSYLANFPELRHLRARMACQSFVLDGEIVVLDQDGVAHFDRVASRLKVDDLASVHRLARSHRAVLYVFDLLYLDGHDLRKVPWVERRQLLNQVFRPDWWVRLSECLPGSGTELFQWVTQRGLEGLIAKRHTAPYVGGRSDGWLKLKLKHTIDCVVVGYTAPRGGRQGLGSLILARYEEGKLRCKGRVGSGFSQSDLRDWTVRLQKNQASQPPVEDEPRATTPVTWCEPRHVVEVEYARVTKDGQLFHPTFVRERPELSPLECSDEPVAQQTLFRQLDHRTIKISSADKRLFPEAGVSKVALVDYYLQVADQMLPHLKNRPLSLRRYPDGVAQADFFQKHPAPGFPEWLQNQDRIVVEEPAGLAYLTNLGTVEFHCTLARMAHLDAPDGVLIDLDPQPRCDFAKVRRVALEMNELLSQIGWHGAVKTTGSRGIHIMVPLAEGYSFEQSRLVASLFADRLERRLPDLVTLVRNPAKRAPEKVYIDAPQNREAATVAAAWSVRATPGASVSVPLRWSEVREDMEINDFTVLNLEHWLPGRESLWTMGPQPEHRLESLLAKLEVME